MNALCLAVMSQERWLPPGVPWKPCGPTPCSTA
jgi:hypothetical protein